MRQIFLSFLPLQVVPSNSYPCTQSQIYPGCSFIHNPLAPQGELKKIFSMNKIIILITLLYLLLKCAITFHIHQCLCIDFFEYHEYNQFDIRFFLR